jgi:outer membrane protein assembly factor BamB
VTGQVIELDVSKPWAPDAVERRGPPIGLVLVVAAFLVAVLTGPVLTTARPFAFVWRTPTLEGAFWLAPQALLTLEPHTSEGARRVVLAARDPDTGDPLWRVRLSGPLSETYGTDGEVLVTNFPPAVNRGMATYVIDTTSGRTLRAYPSVSAALVYVAGDVVLIIDREPPDPRAPPVASSSTGDGDPFDTGIGYTHLAEARDLRTGSVRWTRRLPAGTLWGLPGVLPGTEGIVGLPPGEEWMVTFTYAGGVTTWDVGTGAMINKMALRPLSPVSYVAALNDAVLVRVREGSTSQYTTYDMPRLQERWRMSPPEIDATPFGCGPLLCLATDTSVWAVDPDTGGIAWQLPGVRLRSASARARVLVTGLGQPLARYEAVTGRPLPADPSWRVADISSVSERVVLAASRPGGGAVIALFDVGADTVRELGVVPGVGLGMQCGLTAKLLACEQGGMVRVWHPG